MELIIWKYFYVCVRISMIYERTSHVHIYFLCVRIHLQNFIRNEIIGICLNTDAVWGVSL